METKKHEAGCKALACDGDRAGPKPGCLYYPPQLPVFSEPSTPGYTKAVVLPRSRKSIETQGNTQGRGEGPIARAGALICVCLPITILARYNPSYGMQ